MQSSDSSKENHDLAVTQSDETTIIRGRKRIKLVSEATATEEAHNLDNFCQTLGIFFVLFKICICKCLPLASKTFFITTWL